MGYFDSAIAEREDYLEHHGILGQKWGVRRFESASGHLTPAGQARYNTVDGKYQKVKAAKAKANESYKKFNSDWNRAALATVSLSKKKRAEAVSLRAKAKVSGEKADKDIANIKKAKTDLKFEKKIQKMDRNEQKILDARAKRREKLENKRWDEEKKAAKLKDFDEGTKMVQNGYGKYKKVLDNYRHAKMGDLDKESAKSAKRDYVKQVLSDAYYGSKTITALSYGAKEARGVKNTAKAEKKVVRKKSNANAVQKAKRNPVVVQDVEKKAIKTATKPINGDGYYGNSNKFKASNGVTVGAPKNKTVEAFRAVQGTKVGGAALNGVAKLNTAFYGHGSAKKTWQRIEEQTRKETAAVQEANRAHKEAERERRRR